MIFIFYLNVIYPFKKKIMKHGLWLEHLTQHGYRHVDTINVNNLGHWHHNTYINLFIIIK